LHNLDSNGNIEEFVLTEQESLQQFVRKSDLVFVGVLLSLGKPPLYWSGGSNAYQTAKYKVERILKGQYGASEISIDHVLVWGSRTAESGETPGLSRNLFAVNSRLIVGARRADSGIWKALDEDYGALPATDEWIRKINSALSTK